MVIESEYDGQAPMEKDELISDREDEEPQRRKAGYGAEAGEESESEVREDDEGRLQMKRKAVDKAKIAGAVTRYSCLLGQRELLKNFVDIKKASDPEYAAILDSQPKLKGPSRKKSNQLLLNGMLADEMVPGKSISFLAYLNTTATFPGPASSSSSSNSCRTEEPANIIATRFIPQEFMVCITSYGVCLIKQSASKKFSTLGYIAIDDVHRIKDVDSILSQVDRAFSSRGRLLITFLQKDLEAEGMVEEEKSKRDVEAPHKILRPFLLRRVKTDSWKGLLPNKEINIYLGLKEMWRRYYRLVLEKDIITVNGLQEMKTRLINVVMQLPKVTRHPYLFGGTVKPGASYTTDERFNQNSGKMLVDKLLSSMKEKGPQALIFSQMSRRVFDILKNYGLVLAVHGGDELMEMMTHGGEKIINFTTAELLINADINAIIQPGEERTIELNSNYDGLNVEDLNNSKSEALVQQWDGDSHCRENGTWLYHESPIVIETRTQDFQFFLVELSVLQGCELAAHKRLNGIPAVALSSSAGYRPNLSTTTISSKGSVYQTRFRQSESSRLPAAGQGSRDLQRSADDITLAGEIRDKSVEDVEKYWMKTTRPCRIKVRIEEGEAKRRKRENLENPLSKKIHSMRFPMQEQELNYLTTKGKVYSEEEDRYLLCQLYNYGIQPDDVWLVLQDSVAAGVAETLLGMIEKDEKTRLTKEAKLKLTKGKKRVIEEVQKVESRPPTPAETVSAKKKKT
ncbi:hypothetical protein GALMADRAFT_147142 [Galerina marginata CBS 339.88]|uniref:Uncharacterized protein n=1 Tax=Galerina marginata (strain CBS 339.88) TaxID=685588 RepID=A0A067S926_GALM3|nr:hypothetical protein GALMADRAFT_147142 [Galerina marginata CBS 339.88]